MLHDPRSGAQHLDDDILVVGILDVVQTSAPKRITSWAFWILLGVKNHRKKKKTFKAS
jgi:hypothetical protein